MDISNKCDSNIMSPQREIEPAMRLHPVSRISFALTDTDAFERATRFSVKWLAEKAGGVLPSEAIQLMSFDTRGLEGYYPCHAIRVDDSQGSIWASRIDEPGTEPKAGEIWSTEIFVEKRANSMVRFGAQLMVRRPVGASTLYSSRPRLVHKLLRELSAEADGESISESITSLNLSDVTRLADLIYRPNRRLPIVAVSADIRGEAQIDIKKLAKRLSGAAHLVAIDQDASWELTRLVDRRMSTFNGAVRLYMPGAIEEDDDPYQHPLWLMPPSGRNSRLIDILAERIFPLGFRDGDGEARFWHLAQLRQAVSAAEARRKTGSETDQLRSQIAALNDQVDDLKETLETAIALEKIAASNEKLAQHEVEQLKSENERLRATLYRFKNLYIDQGKEPIKPIDRALRNYEDIGDWADEVLGAHIFLHAKALKDCRQNGHPDMLKRIENTLIAIRDYWIPYKIEGGLDRKNAAIHALAALGVEDEACFARREKAREKPEYSVQEGGVKWVLYDHFKYGTSRSNAEQFRIYYAWDEDRRRLIVGKMPSHLTNDMT